MQENDGIMIGRLEGAIITVKFWRKRRGWRDFKKALNQKQILRLMTCKTKVLTTTLHKNAFNLLFFIRVPV